MNYYSTRNSKLDKKFDEIIIEGLASDGGLYMPKLFPKININELQNNENITYPELASRIISLYVGDTIALKELEGIAQNTYKKFSHDKVAPLLNIDGNKYILELFHGPTYAFKDYPLQMLGNLFQYYLKKKKKNISAWR